MTKKRNNKPVRPPPSASSRPSSAPSVAASSSNAAPAKSASPSVSAVEDDEQQPGPPNAAGVVGKANKLMAMLMNETQRLESMDLSKPDDLASTINSLGQDVSDFNTATVSNIATLSSSVVEFVGMIRKAPKKTDGSSVKAVTRFLTTNGLKVASTVISAAKAASQFVPIPGIAVAIGIIDNILANVKDGMDSIGGLKSFLADLKELKMILAPMANQWFSADVRGKCAELVDLLKEVQISIEAGTSTMGSWFMLVIGSKKAEVEAQMAGYRGSEYAREEGRADDFIET
ncbi:hypothetical protein BC831DRAFT_158570 [Entophlyctis helioformis]|nr:hypothetical protein BC831DRAFT_158570 [Entophlyctis helioformis]